MKILFFTNTYLPHVGGVARSIASFSAEFRRLGHKVLTIAPQFDPPQEDEAGVVRVPAVTHFNGTDFSVPMPVPGIVASAVDQFGPDVVHTHHPFLMGGTALRIAQSRKLPLIFTHHTMYDQFTHYLSGEPAEESPRLTQFVASLVSGYANLCDQIIAPSQSVADLLRSRGVETPIEVIPTGIDTQRFAHGDSGAFRLRHGIPPDVPVVGHVGRLALEKNLGFLSRAVADFLSQHSEARFLVVGSGPCEQDFPNACRAVGVEDRLVMAGTCEGQELIDAYHAMDVFAFASHSETQGMVVAEAMAAGLPVVALDGPGVREVVADGKNGRLLMNEDLQQYARALKSVLEPSATDRQALKEAALATAQEYSLPRTAERELALYQRVMDRVPPAAMPGETTTAWDKAKGRLRAEWNLLTNVAQAAGAALDPTPPAADRPPR
jgi:1,2-diacylglycerol 3-alpha-glucosyltransferase